MRLRSQFTSIVDESMRSRDGDNGALDRDADLKPWMEAGKLLWIQPGDTSLTLRSLQ